VGRRTLVDGTGLGFGMTRDFFLSGIVVSGDASSETQGSPMCGPRKFRIDEKCSQS
jgi:hypothetical protein